MKLQTRLFAIPIAIASLWTHAAGTNALSDSVGELMGLKPGQVAEVVPVPARPHTSFQTAGPFYPAIGVPTDAVLVYSSDPKVINSWGERGQILQTMFGFRDYKNYVEQHPDAVQTDSEGKPLMCDTSYYLDPTPERIEISKKFAAAALAAGSTAICPEEPEYFSHAGYSGAFKREWETYFGASWQAPHSSVDARYRSEELKAFLECRQINAILEHTRQVNPAAARMVAVHSPVSYYQWSIPVPHYALLNVPGLQEIIAQVWTGTARSMGRAAGVRRERTFEVGFLEYSSLFHLARGTEKRLWFLMDPVEDNPHRPMEDYHINYEQTLLAALMFPEVDSFEVMPWPQRIYERVPPQYATEVNTVVGALCDMWQYPRGRLSAGTPDIGTLVADSMGWQRGAPHRSDYDGFYALCLPLVLRGVPVQVLSLDRAADPTYLAQTKVLLLSYDFLKPSGPHINRALAEWTQAGGSLVIFGGQDAYDAVTNSWWRKAGFDSPLGHLFSELNLSVQRIDENSPTPGVAIAPELMGYQVVLSGDGGEHNLQNRKHYTLDLTPFAQSNGTVSVRFEDISPETGWGPWLASAELRVGDQVAASFSAGSSDEARFLAEDGGSMVMGEGRFADGSHHWVYSFDNLPKGTPIKLVVDLGNGFLVKARASRSRARWLGDVGSALGAKLPPWQMPNGYATSLYSLPAKGKALCRMSDRPAPIAWKSKIGRGTVSYVGIAPGAFTTTAQSDAWLRALIKSACDRTKYQESGRFLVRRGPYSGVRAFDQPFIAQGYHINLLDPTLPLVKDAQIAPGGWGFFLEAGPMGGTPRLLAVSGRLRARAEQSHSTGFLVQAPAKTEGVARLWAGRGEFAQARVFSIAGKALTNSWQIEGKTVAVHYPNDPDGVVVRVEWK